MRIVGFVETSLVDWDGRIASVVFVGGCNLRCPFCHNHQIARDDSSLPTIQWPEIAALLERKLGWVDGVVVSGGEPMMHPEVFGLCRAVRKLGLRVKIDTNGSFPYALKRIIGLGLVDCVAMDIKAAPGRKYAIAAGRPVNMAGISRTVRLLAESAIESELRTTLVPGLVDPEDVPVIGELVRGSRTLVLQQFVPEKSAAEAYRKKRPYDRTDAEAMLAAFRPFVNEVKLRGKFF